MWPSLELFFIDNFERAEDLRGSKNLGIFGHFFMILLLQI
jgi:hypothetical protein